MAAVKDTTIPVKNAEFNKEILQFYMEIHIKMPDLPIKFYIFYKYGRVLYGPDDKNDQ